MPAYTTLLLFVFAMTVLNAQTALSQLEDSISKNDVRASVSAGLRNLVRAAENYPSHADCFSCHHQTIPLAALQFCKNNKELELEAILGKSPSKVVEEITNFTRESLVASQSDLDTGKPIDGRATTLGYGMWVFALAGQSQDSIAQSLRRNAMQTQSRDGSWEYHSFRPPASSSRAMATALTLFGFSQLDRQTNANAFLAPDFVEKSAKVRIWLNETKLQPSMEEQFGAFWCRILTAPEQRLNDAAVYEIVEGLRKLQRDDGGWAQEPNMASDAYATGQALVMLAELCHPSHRDTNSVNSSPVEANQMADTKIQDDELYKKGVRFLLANQEQPGAWHVVTRAEPVQPFFDNGDPFGKDQFISTMATGWATIALASYIDSTTSPLSLNNR